MAFRLPAIGFAFRRGGRVARLRRVSEFSRDPGTGRNSEAGGDESQEIQFALGENDIKVLTMTVHDETVFDNQSQKLFM